MCNRFNIARSLFYLLLSMPIPAARLISGLCLNPFSLHTSHFDLNISRLLVLTLLRVLDAALGLVGSQIKYWLLSPCIGPPIRMPGADPRQIPRPFCIGSMLLHASHKLFVYKALIICRTCNFVVGHSVRKIREPGCVDLAVAPSLRGHDNLQRRWQGLLPKSAPC